MKTLALASVSFALLFAPTIARADALKDVADIRAGKLPVTAEWLGWDGSRTAHFRKVVCSEGGTTSCRVSFVALTPGASPKATTVLDIAEVYCDPTKPCEALDAKTARAFVVADRNASASLPALVTTAPASDPATVVGPIAGEPTRVEVRALEVDPNDPTNLVVELALRGKGGATERLEILDRRVYRLESDAIKAAYPSPDGKSVAFVIRTKVGVMCWSFDAVSTPAIDLPRTRASLANTIGFRAYKKNDMTGALAAFKEATTHDPSFGLGWYNTAALESRAGDVTRAKASFDKAKAIDADFATRACGDRDFDALRAREPGVFRCK